MGALTRYSFGWLIIPLVIFLAIFGGPRRVILALFAFVVFLVVLSPWLVRNYNLSGSPFGTSTYAILEGTYIFPEYRLQRSLEPNLSQGLVLSAFWQKLIGNTRQILQNEVPKLGGSWVTALFLTGLLMGFRSPSLKRLRYFVVSCLFVLVIAQALQKYGVYIGDSGGATALKLEDTRTEGRGQLWTVTADDLCMLPFTSQFWDVLPEGYDPSAH